MDVLAALSCCCAHTGSAKNLVHKQSLLARTYPQLHVQPGPHEHMSADNEQKQRTRNLHATVLAVRMNATKVVHLSFVTQYVQSGNEKSCSSSDGGLMTITLASTYNKKYFHNTFTAYTVAFQESESDVERLEKIIHYWKKWWDKSRPHSCQHPEWMLWYGVARKVEPQWRKLDSIKAME